jgi:hypothetical protein
MKMGKLWTPLTILLVVISALSGILPGHDTKSLRQRRSQ